MKKVILILTAVMALSPAMASAQTQRHNPNSLRCQQAQWNLIKAEGHLRLAIARGGDVEQAQLNEEWAQRAVRRYC